MAIDAPGLFNNDSSNYQINFINELGQEEIERILRNAAASGDDFGGYLTNEHVTGMWLVGELYASALGMPGDHAALDPSYEPTYGRFRAIANSLKPSPADVCRVIELLEPIVTGDNEYLEAMRDFDAEDEWKAEVLALLQRLRKAVG